MIPAIVLAAGRSSRMGVSKATLRVDDRDTFLSRIVRTFHAAGVEDIVVVLGHDAEAIRTSLASCDVPVRVAINREYERGQLSSIRTGLNVVDRPGVEAVLMTLVDVPLVTDATVRAVRDRFRQSRAPIVRPTSGARHGHPIVIARSLFDAVRRADDDEGAKPIIRAHASVEGDVEVDDEGAFIDIDTAAEYERILKRPVADSGANR